MGGRRPNASCCRLPCYAKTDNRTAGEITLEIIIKKQWYIKMSVKLCKNSKTSGKLKVLLIWKAPWKEGRGHNTRMLIWFIVQCKERALEHFCLYRVQCSAAGSSGHNIRKSCLAAFQWLKSERNPIPITPLATKILKKESQYYWRMSMESLLDIHRPSWWWLCLTI